MPIEIIGAVIGAVAAVTIGLIGIGAQAHFQARTARLALFQQRMEVVRAFSNLTFQAGRPALNRWFYRNAARNGRLDEEKAPLESALRVAKSKSADAEYLFGPEVKAPFMEAIALASEILRAAEHDARPTAEELISDKRTGRNRLPGEFVERVIAASEAFSRRAEPYVGKERLVGLPWHKRARIALGRLFAKATGPWGRLRTRAGQITDQITRRRSRLPPPSDREDGREG